MENIFLFIFDLMENINATQGCVKTRQRSVFLSDGGMNRFHELLSEEKRTILMRKQL